MTETARKALALVNEVQAETCAPSFETLPQNCLTTPLLRAIEQHEAHRQEVSDAVTSYYDINGVMPHRLLAPFIIAKPDPLVEVLNEVMPEVTVDGYGVADAEELRTALAARGGRIVFDGDAA